MSIVCSDRSATTSHARNRLSLDQLTDIATHKVGSIELLYQLADTGVGRLAESGPIVAAADRTYRSLNMKSQVKLDFDTTNYQVQLIVTSGPGAGSVLQMNCGAMMNNGHIPNRLDTALRAATLAEALSLLQN